MRGTLADKVRGYEQHRLSIRGLTSPQYSASSTRMMSPFQNRFVTETLEEVKHSLFHRDPSVVEVCDDGED